MKLMIDDHTKSQDSLKAVATQCNVPVPTEPEGKHARLRDKIGRRVGQWRGPGFDDAGVSIAPPKIPYGGFSPVRLQGQPVRPHLPTSRRG
jgi:hypothetical protein